MRPDGPPISAPGQSPTTERGKLISGEIVPFYEVCPDAGEEMRVMTVQGHPRLPADDYGLIDGFCADPDCDCRVIYFLWLRLFSHLNSSLDLHEYLFAPIGFCWLIGE